MCRRWCCIDHASPAKEQAEAAPPRRRLKVRDGQGADVLRLQQHAGVVRRRRARRSSSSSCAGLRVADISLRSLSKHDAIVDGVAIQANAANSGAGAVTRCGRRGLVARAVPAVKGSWQRCQPSVSSRLTAPGDARAEGPVASGLPTTEPRPPPPPAPPAPRRERSRDGSRKAVALAAASRCHGARRRSADRAVAAGRSGSKPVGAMSRAQASSKPLTGISQPAGRDEAPRGRDARSLQTRLPRRTHESWCSVRGRRARTHPARPAQVISSATAGSERQSEKSPSTMNRLGRAASAPTGA